MGPRAEFVLLAALAGAVVTVLGYAAAATLVFAQTPAEMLRAGLQWSPSGALAAAAAAWLASAWHVRAARAGRSWSAWGLALRAAFLALLLYPLAVGGWALATVALDQRLASGGMPLREFLRWVPSIMLGATVTAVLAGALPALAIAFFLGRRYLRRRAGSTTDIA